MRKHWRLATWIIAMLILGFITLNFVDVGGEIREYTDVYGNVQHYFIRDASYDFILFLMPVIAAIISIWIWGVIGFKFTFGGQQQRQKSRHDTKLKNVDDRLTRLVDDLDENQIIELETLLASRYEEHS